MLDSRTQEALLAVPNHPAFPNTQIEEKLRSWWQRKASSPLSRTNSDPRKSGGTVLDILPEVSSTEAVEVFLDVEPILGFKLKSSGVIKPGGYRSSDEFVQHMLPRLEAKFAEHNPPTTLPAKTPGEDRAHAS